MPIRIVPRPYLRGARPLQHAVSGCGFTIQSHLPTVFLMISCPSVQKHVIQRHYDVSTLFYRLLWGPHIHHGLWYGDENIAQAQLQLTDELAKLAGVTPGLQVLDVGCGMGGSSIHLAKRYGCSVTGVTLSPLQRCWAATSSRWHRVHRTTCFKRVDAEAYEAAPRSLDLLWSIECTEHLFDKSAFFQRAAAWLRLAVGWRYVLGWRVSGMTGACEATST